MEMKSPPPPASPSERNLTVKEMSRLSCINSRTLCISFKSLSLSNFPSTTSLMSLNTSIQSLVQAKGPRPWCFMIFPTKGLRMEAEMQLDNKKCGQETMVVDKTKMLVPVKADELENTRDSHSLAVHGIPPGTREDDIRAVFPRTKHVTIAKRGGSAFLNYVSKEQCEEDFVAFEDAEVKGASVVVMFGHHLQRTGGQVDKIGDLRERLETSRNRESWAPLLNFVSELRNVKKNGQEVEYSSSLSTMSEVLLFSNLRLDRMRKQFRRNKGREEMMGIKISWLDTLVATVCQKSDLQESEVSVLERGGMRQLVEDMWLFLDTFRDSEEEEWEGRGGWSEDRKERRSLSKSSDIKVSFGERSGNSFLDNREKGIRDKSRSVEQGQRGRDLRELEKRRDEKSRRRKSRSRSTTGKPASSRSDERRRWRDRSRSRKRDGSRSSKRERSRSGRSRSQTALSERSWREDDRRRGREDRRLKSEKNERSYKSVSRSRSSESRRSSSSQQVLNVDKRQVKVVDGPVDAMEQDLQNNNSSLSNYLEKKLCGLGLKEEMVVLEVNKIMVTIRQVVEDVGKMSMQQCELLELLSKSGYKSGHVSVRLAADLVVEWALKGGTEAVKISKVEEIQPVGEEERENHDQGIPCEIMGVEEGYPRMALVMAFYLHTERGLEEQISKDLARAMVGVWITYGFTYQQMCEVCQGMDQQEVKVEGLRKMLNSKLTEGFVKPMSFGFSKLIKLTLFYFTHATC